MEFKEFKTRAGASLRFSEIGFGSAPLGDLFKKLDEAAAQDTVRAAYADGIRLFDSSPHYGNGLAEARMGAALRDKPRDDLVISTKVGRWMDPFTPGRQAARRRDLARVSRAGFRTGPSSIIPMTGPCGRSSNRCCARASAGSTSC